MTENDTRRIHERLDEIISVMGDQAVSIAKLNTSFESMLATAARTEATRAATCPRNTDIGNICTRLGTIETNLRTLKWFGGIVTVGLLIPGINWFGQRLWAVLIG